MRDMKLLNRQKEFVRLLIAEKTYKPTEYFADLLNVSVKTARRDLIPIEDLLQHYNLILQKRTGYGLWMDAEGGDCQKLLNDMDISDDTADLSTNARRKEILRRLLFGGETTSITRLMQEFYVSRASIINDFKYISDRMKLYHVRIVSGSYGRELKGEEYDILQAMVDFISEFGCGKSEIYGGIPSKLSDIELRKLTAFFELEEIFFVEKLMESMVASTDIDVANQYYMPLLKHILVLLHWGRTGHTLPCDDEFAADIPCVKRICAHEIIDKLNREFSLNMGQGEATYLMRCLVSFGIVESKPGTQKNEEDDLAFTLLSDMNLYMKKALCLGDGLSEELGACLLTHIYTMLRRIQYGVQIRSEIMEEIRREHAPLYELCCNIMWCVVQKYAIKPASPDEISYLAAYYQTMVEEKQMQKNVVVVSHGEAESVKLLISKLKKRFPYWSICEVQGARSIANSMLRKRIDLILATIPWEAKTIPCVTVSRFLTQNDLERIDLTLQQSKAHNEVSLPLLKDLCQRGLFNIRMVEDTEKDIPVRNSVHIEHCLEGERIQWVIGICHEERITIYRVKDTNKKWSVLIFARTYDALMEEIAELHALLNDGELKEKIDKCFSADELVNYI